MDELIKAQRERIYEAGARAICAANGKTRWENFRHEAVVIYAAMHAMTIAENNIKRELQQAAFDDLMTDQS